MNDVEGFALVLSTISRSLVDLKGKHSLIKICQFYRCFFYFIYPASFPILREKLSSIGSQSTLNDDQK